MVRDRDKYNAYQRVYQLERSRRRKTLAIEILGGECTKCTSTMHLEVDHKDWRNKTLNIAKLWSVALSKFLDEMPKCQLLCRDCHREKTRQDLREMWQERWTHRLVERQND